MFAVVIYRPRNYVYTHRNLFIETLGIFPKYGLIGSKSYQRMFPVNDSNINDILELWNIFKTIKIKVYHR